MNNIPLPFDIQRPVLLLNEERVRNNIQCMAQKAQQNRLRFRPHFKTHQSAQIGGWFRDAGVNQITVSSVEMAQYFAANGWEDITIAFPVNLRQINALNELTEKTRLHLTIETLAEAQALRSHLHHPLHIWLNVNTGYDRDGLNPVDMALIEKMLAELGKSRTLKLQGLLTHAGHTYAARGKIEVSRIYRDGMQKMLALKERLAALGYNKLEISIGDTPTCSLLDEFTGVDEIRPGTFVFYDQRQLGIGSCKEEEIAAAVACPVVGVYPQRSEIAIYGGAAHLSKDYNPQEDGSRCYGRAALLNATGWGEALPHTSLYSLSQEIGLIKTTPEICQTIRTGSILMILPVHICLTVNAMRHYTTLKGQVIDCMPL